MSSLEELDQKLSSLVTEGLPSGGLQQLGLLCDDTPLEGRGSSWCYCGGGCCWEISSGGFRRSVTGSNDRCVETFVGSVFVVNNA